MTGVRSRAADYPGEPRCRVAIYRGGTRPIGGVRAWHPGEPCGQVAISQGGSSIASGTEVVQLLSHRGSALDESDTQLGQVLLHQRQLDVLSTQVRWILRPRYFADR